MSSKQTKSQKGGGSPPRQLKEQLAEEQALSQEKETGNQDLKDFITKAFTAQNEQLNFRLESFEKKMEKITNDRHEKIKEEIVTAVTGLSDAVRLVNEKVDGVVAQNKDIDVKLKDTNTKLDEVDNLAARIENEVTMIQFRSMEYAIRLRGIEEHPRENLREVCSHAIAVILGGDPEMVATKMDKVYRVNSWFAKRNHVPRDVVIYFTERRIRNDIVYNSFHKGVLVAGREVGVYKELPPRMLRIRKDFGFLVTELKKRNVLFRWDAPAGLVFTYKDTRYRLTTIEKAKEFYFTVLKRESSADSPSSFTEEQEQAGEFEKETEEQILQTEREQAMELKGATGGEELLVESLPEILIAKPKPKRQRRQQDPTDQRQIVTRHITALEKGRQQLEALPSPPSNKESSPVKLQEPEAVGGAKPKVLTVEQALQKTLVKLQGANDGN